MITVHHLENSRSHRIVWLLEEMGLPYDLVPHRRDPLTHRAPRSLRDIHPLGKAPILADDGVVVAESGAIMEYLLDRYPTPALRPVAGSAAALRFTYWLHYAEGSLMPPLVMRMLMGLMVRAPMPFLLRPVLRRLAGTIQRTVLTPEVALHLGFLEETLEQSNWFAGDDFSAADIQMSFAVELAAACHLLDFALPNLTAFLRRIRVRPAYIRAQERGGALSLAF